MNQNRFHFVTKCQKFTNKKWQYPCSWSKLLKGGGTQLEKITPNSQWVNVVVGSEEAHFKETM
jgi:hypothetical protein